MKITIPGHPISKMRARVTRKGFAYDPQWQEKKRIREYLTIGLQEFFKKEENKIEGRKLSNGEAFEVNWCFHMPIPKSFSQFKKNASEWQIFHHVTKPDLSNILKFYEDCANGILWKDDSQITCGYIKKNYSNNPRTEIHMKSIDNPNEDVQEIISLFSPDEISVICDDAGKINLQDVKLFDVAGFLSKLADQHSKKLTKIAKNHPGYWKKLGNNSASVQY